MNERFKKEAKQAGVKRKNLSIHSIRHTVATHLLEAGADIRYVRELLGHESIETTVIYTHTMYENLNKVYKCHHPREVCRGNLNSALYPDFIYFYSLFSTINLFFTNI